MASDPFVRPCAVCGGPHDMMQAICETCRRSIEAGSRGVVQKDRMERACRLCNDDPDVRNAADAILSLFPRHYERLPAVLLILDRLLQAKSPSKDPAVEERREINVAIQHQAAKNELGHAVDVCGCVRYEITPRGIRNGPPVDVSRASHVQNGAP